MRVSPGLAHMVAAAFYFSLMSVFVKLAGRTLPSSEIVFFRAAVSLVLTSILLRRAGISPWGHRRGLLFLRGLLGFLGLLCFFSAITRLPLADVTVIHYTNPVLTALLAALLLGEGIHRRDMVGLALSLAGVILVARPGFLFGAATALDPGAVTLAMGGAVFSALAYTTVRKLGQTEHYLVVVFWFPLVATPGSIPLMLEQAIMPAGMAWIWLLGVGLATQAAQIHLTRGLHAEKAGRAMSMSYIQILFAAVLGALVFGDLPGPWTWLGAGLVVAGTLVVAGSSGKAVRRQT